MSKFAEFDPKPRGGRPADAPGWAIRPVTADDAPALARISSEREGVPCDRRALVRAERVVRKSRNPARSLCLVAVRGGTVVGFGKTALVNRSDPCPPNSLPSGWYLTGVIVEPESRRLGIGRELTRLRLLQVAERAGEVWYFANARNLASIALHESFGFTEVTRDFVHPRVRFEAGHGILFRCDLQRPMLKTSR